MYICWCAKMREIVYTRANRAVFGFNFAFLRIVIAVKSVCVAVSERFLLHCLELEKSSKLSIAA